MSTNTAAITTLAAEVTAGIRQLSLLTRASGTMGEMVTALEALAADDGPLAEMGEMLGSASGWLLECEHDDAQSAGDRMEDTSGYTESIRYSLDRVLRMIRPLGA